MTKNEINLRMGVFHGEAPAVASFKGGRYELGPITREQARQILARGVGKPSTKSPEAARIAARMGMSAQGSGVTFIHGRYELNMTPEQARRHLASVRAQSAEDAAKVARLALAAGES